MGNKIDDQTISMIKELLEEKKNGKEWTIIGIAETAGVSIPTVRKVRDGKLGLPSKQYDIPPEKLIEWDEVRMPFVRLAEQRDRRMANE
ncbi:MAG TPA: hypothetical protein IAC41_09245 [Candidatus Merdenecus merdavium]|nr:hypothetical protein [Candidatus Merdenecus merdavium]